MLSSYSPELLLARILSYTEFAKLSYHQFMTFRRYAWRFIYRNLNIVMLSIKTSGDFYLFYDFPYGKILTLFMQYLGTLNIADSHMQH